MTIHTAAKLEIQHPPLARDALGNLLAIPEGTCAWRVSRETTGRPREIRGPDKQPIRFPLDTTSDELVELCGSGVYRVYALDEVGAQLADEHVAKWDLTPGTRELRNGAPDVPMLASLRPSSATPQVTDLRFALEAMTQMMRTNSDALRVVTEAHVDLAKVLATAKGLPRNAAFMMPPAHDDEEDDDDEDDERPRHAVELLMPFAAKLAEMMPGVVMGKLASSSKPNAKALAPSNEGGPDKDLANRPNWEARDFVDLHYANRKAEAKRAVKENTATRASAIAAMQARIVADPALVQHLVAIKTELASDEIETLMAALGTTAESEQTKFLDSIKSLPVNGAVAFCREVVAAVRSHAASAAEQAS